jgi:hypothetical protein
VRFHFGAKSTVCFKFLHKTFSVCPGTAGVALSWEHEAFQTAALHSIWAGMLSGVVTSITKGPLNDSLERIPVPL